MAILGAAFGFIRRYALAAATLVAAVFVALWTRAAYRAGRAVEQAKRSEDAATAIARAQAAARDYDRSKGGVVDRLRRGEF
jgi:hypothetical protein